MSNSVIEVSAKNLLLNEKGEALLDEHGKKVYETGTIRYDVGGSIQEAIEKFGSDVVYDAFVRDSKLVLQDFIRKNLTGNIKGDALQQAADGYVIGTKAPRVTVDPTAAVLSSFGQWTPEEQQRFLEKLQSTTQG